MNKKIVEALMEVGQRNLVIFIVLPTIFLLEMYAAVLRSHALFHIYKTADKRRAYKIYNDAKKKELYLRGKTKYMSYAKPPIKKAKGRFLVKKTEEYPQGIPYETFELEAYLKKKHDVFANVEAEEEEEDYETHSSILLSLVLSWILKKFDMSQNELANEFKAVNIGLTQQAISLRLGKLKEKA